MTAGHNLKGYKPDIPIKYVARTDAELIEAPKEVAAKGSPFEKISIEGTLPVLRAHVFDDKSEDIGVILLEPAQAERLQGFHFFPVEQPDYQTPNGLDFVAMSGFAQEIASSIRLPKTHITMVRLYTEYSKMVADPGNLRDFNSEIHYLLRFPEEESMGDGELLSDLHGISGCGVWQIIKNQPGEVWRIRTNLIGVQTGVYPGRLIKCTRIETAFDCLKRFLAL